MMVPAGHRLVTRKHADALPDRLLGSKALDPTRAETIRASEACAIKVG
jgi:hypothetical protein